MDSGSDKGKVWATSVASGRPDPSILLRKPGNVFDLQFSIGPPGHGKEQIRQAVDPGDDIRADRFGMRQLHDLSLGPPRDRSGQMQPGRDFGAPGEHERGHGHVPRFHFIDELFHLGDGCVGEANRLFFVGGALGGGQVGTDVEQTTLTQVQYGVHPAQETFVFSGKRAHRQANGGIGFINRAIRRHPWMIFGDSTAAKEPGGSIIARSCVELHCEGV